MTKETKLKSLIKEIVKEEMTSKKRLNEDDFKIKKLKFQIDKLKNRIEKNKYYGLIHHFSDMGPRTSYDWYKGIEDMYWNREEPDYQIKKSEAVLMKKAMFDKNSWDEIQKVEKYYGEIRKIKQMIEKLESK